MKIFLIIELLALYFHQKIKVHFEFKKVEYCRLDILVQIWNFIHCVLAKKIKHTFLPDIWSHAYIRQEIDFQYFSIDLFLYWISTIFIY